MEQKILNKLDNLYTQFLISEMYKLNLISEETYRDYLQNMFDILIKEKELGLFKND